MMSRSIGKFLFRNRANTAGPHKPLGLKNKVLYFNILDLKTDIGKEQCRINAKTCHISKEQNCLQSQK